MVFEDFPCLVISWIMLKSMSLGLQKMMEICINFVSIFYRKWEPKWRQNRWKNRYKLLKKSRWKSISKNYRFWCHLGSIWESFGAPFWCQLALIFPLGVAWGPLGPLGLISSGFWMNFSCIWNHLGDFWESFLVSVGTHLPSWNSWRAFGASSVDFYWFLDEFLMHLDVQFWCIWSNLGCILSYSFSWWWC